MLFAGHKNLFGIGQRLAAVRFERIFRRDHNQFARNLGGGKRRAGCFPSPALPGSGSTGLLHSQNSQPSGSPHKGKTTSNTPHRQAVGNPAHHAERSLPPSLFFPVSIIDKNKSRLKVILRCTAIVCNNVTIICGCCFCNFIRRKALHSGGIGGGDSRQCLSHNMLCHSKLTHGLSFPMSDGLQFAGENMRDCY